MFKYLKPEDSKNMGELCLDRGVQRNSKEAVETKLGGAKINYFCEILKKMSQKGARRTVSPPSLYAYA